MVNGQLIFQILKIIKFNKYCPAPDYENCHIIASEDTQHTKYYLMQGFEEIYDHTEYVKIYRTADCIWSKEQHVDGYEYTGTYKEIYKTV